MGGARRTLGGLGAYRVPVPAFAPVQSLHDVAEFAEAHGWPVVMKRRSGGYDGRGVQVVADAEEARRLLSETANGADPGWLVEEHLDLAGEFAILLARNPSGFITRYPPIATRQDDGICRELSIPADLPATVADTAGRLAESVIAGIDVTGVCAVEFFWTTDGRLLLNELALRPHNSGHITIEACATSQFHQHLRAILDWPLGSVDLLSPAATVNLIAGAQPADLTAALPSALGVPNTHIHLYQKQPRPGRKIGHVTSLAPSADEALDLARTAAQLLLPGQLR
jgi:5-(carboxyamino)imidazole ribonucleotide synthase